MPLKSFPDRRYLFTPQRHGRFRVLPHTSGRLWMFNRSFWAFRIMALSCVSTKDGDVEHLFAYLVPIWISLSGKQPSSLLARTSIQWSALLAQSLILGWSSFYVLNASPWADSVLNCFSSSTASFSQSSQNLLRGRSCEFLCNPICHFPHATSSILFSFLKFVIIQGHRHSSTFPFQEKRLCSFIYVCIYFRKHLSTNILKIFFSLNAL